MGDSVDIRIVLLAMSSKEVLGARVAVNHKRPLSNNTGKALPSSVMAGSSLLSFFPRVLPLFLSLTQNSTKVAPSLSLWPGGGQRTTTSRHYSFDTVYHDDLKLV
jgi:hypothetical protein